MRGLEFRSQFKISDILNYLDGYPLLLPCRYFNRQACYTKVFLISNVDLDAQYTCVAPESRAAFLRRVHLVTEYTDAGAKTYESVGAYQMRNAYEMLPDDPNFIFPVGVKA